MDEEEAAMMRNLLICSVIAAALWAIGLAFGDGVAIFYVGAMVGMVAQAVIVLTVVRHG